jgi:hypothetical protein
MTFRRGRNKGNISRQQSADNSESTMVSNKQILSLGIAALSLLSAVPADRAWAVNPPSFDVKNSAELVAVCSTPTTDKNYSAAIHFCNGYVVGAFHNYQALAEQPMYQTLFCPDDPNGPKDDFVKGYVAFAKAHPQYDKDRAVTVLFKYMIDKWPCDRQMP